MQNNNNSVFDEQDGFDGDDGIDSDNEQWDKTIYMNWKLFNDISDNLIH